LLKSFAAKVETSADSDSEGSHASLADIALSQSSRRRHAVSTTKPVPRCIGTWVLQGAVAAVFFVAGATKLAAAPFEVQLFAQLGLGQWLRIVTGVVQIVGAFALVYPRLAAIGGVWLGFTMLCAVVANLAVLHTSPVPAIVLGLLNALIVYLHRDELALMARTLLGRR
jgi:putative oxidoreductase